MGTTAQESDARLGSEPEGGLVFVHNGYWGPPSSSAVTPYESLCFVALSIKKRNKGENKKIIIDLDLPNDVLRTL